MVTTQDIAKHNRLQGYSAVDIERALGNLDLELIHKIHIERFSWKLWDWKEPINGHNLQAMKSIGMRFALNGECFFVRDANLGRVVHFQTFDPDKTGIEPMSKRRAEDLAQKACQLLARAAVLDNLTNYAIRKLSNEQQEGR